MSILIFGKSLCPVCNMPICEGDEYYAYPSFVVNVKEPLYIFNDQTLHTDCMRMSKLGEIASNYANTFLEQINPNNRICIIGGNLIKDFEDHIFIDLLTSEINSFLHDFNFIHIDRRNLFKWKIRERFVDELVKTYNGDSWQEIKGGKYLSNLIKCLS